jgi:LDH2 family malate/lactate/ureidoglycolate dehydrogenase
MRYPGQHMLETRRKNMVEGIPVEPSIWKEIQEL